MTPPAQPARRLSRRRGRVTVGGVVAAVLVAGALLLGVTPVSDAHEVDPSVVTLIDEIVPDVAGLDIAIGTSVTTQLLVANHTTEVLEVLADSGEPFLRIGPAGVEANLASPSWYRTNQPFGAQRPPDVASPDAPPRWALVSTASSWGWFDHRLHPRAIASVLGEDRAPTFEVPMRLGATELVVRGHLEQRTSAPRFAAALRAVPEASGLTVQLLQGRAPGLFVRYDGSSTLVVQGADGEPFLRLGPDGASVNRRSPTWVFTAQAQGVDLADAEADPAAPPDWISIAPTPSFAWLDPRALIPEVEDEPVTLDWVVPLEVDGEPMEIHGTSTAAVVALEPASTGAPAPDDGSQDRPWLLPVVAGTALVTAVAAWRLARRPGRAAVD